MKSIFHEEYPEPEGGFLSIPAAQYYYCGDLDEAKGIILTPSKGMSTDQRWEEETKWLADQIVFNDKDSLVVDYGCGIGRVAKVIPNPVLGVDASVTMRYHADIYVKNTRFGSVSPHMFKNLVDNGLRMDGVMAIWALQHVADIDNAIDNLMRALNPGGLFWLLDTNQRSLPVLLKTQGEYKIYGVNGDDRIEIYPLIERWCNLEKVEVVPLYPEVSHELRKYRRLSVV